MCFLANSQSKFDQNFSKNCQLDDHLMSLIVTFGLFTSRLFLLEIEHCVPGTISCHCALMISVLIFPQSHVVITIA